MNWKFAFQTDSKSQMGKALALELQVGTRNCPVKYLHIFVTSISSKNSVKHFIFITEYSLFLPLNIYIEFSTILAYILNLLLCSLYETL